MRETLTEIVALQQQYNSANTPAMQRRGHLIRRTLPEQIRAMAPRLQEALGPYGTDASVEGKDNIGRMARIPWVRCFSRSRAPSATQGWYVVYLFHPDGTGVSLCLSHGSTHFEDGDLVNRTDEEVAELMTWASRVVGGEFAGDPSVRQGISLGPFKLARAYERTTVFSKFYPASQIPPDAQLAADLIRFMGPLAKLYRAQELGIAPGTSSPDLLALKESVEAFIDPLKERARGQGRGLSGAARKLVELHAMTLAREWLREQEFEFTDVSRTDSCDFRARRNGEEWVIEVKGTTGGPGSVLLTRNEVSLHLSSWPRNALLVIHGIQLSDDGTKVAGGELFAHAPWKLDEERLSPVCYEYRLS